MGDCKILRRGGGGSTPPTPRLPEWLQEVEYIQVPSNTYSPYIDSNMPATSDLVLEFDFQCVSVSGSTVSNLFHGGGTTGAYTGTQLSFMIQNYQGKFAGSYAGYRSEESSVIALDTNKHHLLFNNVDQYFTLDTTDVRISRSAGNTFSGTGSNIKLCMGGQNGDYRGIFWEIKMWLRGQSLSRHFVPCYALEAHTAYQGATQTTCAVNEVGLYDLVEGKFYINSGTGSYTRGASINATYLYNEGDECISLTGGWSASAYSSNGLTKYSNYMNITGLNCQYYGGSFTGLVDVSNYAKLLAICKCSGTNADDIVQIKNDLSKVPNVAWSTKYTTINSTSSYKLFEIDLSATSGSYYIGFATGGNDSMDITQAWLE